jgi:hypothetical protein
MNALEKLSDIDTLRLSMSVVAFHAVATHPHSYSDPPQQVANRAFQLAEAFVTEAVARFQLGTQ